MRGDETMGIWTCSSETHLRGLPGSQWLTTLHSTAQGAGWLPGWEREIPLG